MILTLVWRSRSVMRISILLSATFRSIRKSGSGHFVTRLKLFTINIQVNIHYSLNIIVPLICYAVFSDIVNRSGRVEIPDENVERFSCFWLVCMICLLPNKQFTTRLKLVASSV